MENDNQFVIAAMKQIAKEIKDFPIPESRDLKFSDFHGWMYDVELSAQSAILMRAATLKEFIKEQGYVRLA